MSKSGKIRKSLPMLKASTERKIDKAQGFLLQNPRDKLPNDVEHCREIQSQAEEISLNLTDARNKLQAKHDEWENLIDAIADPIKNDAEVQIFEEAAYGDDGYFGKIEEAEENLSALTVHLKRTSEKVISMLAANAANQAQQPRSDRPDRCVRLPELVLPKFRGEVSEFPQFWSLFETMIDSRDLKDTEKFSYLRAQLEGPAFETIAGLLPSESNYQVAVDLLKGRYKMSMGTQIALLHADFKKIKVSGNHVTDKRKTIDNCEKVFRQLEACGASLANDHSLALDLLSKFPSHVIRDLNAYHDISTETRLPALRKALQKYIDNAEKMNDTIDNLRVLSGTDKASNARQTETEGWQKKESNYSSRRYGNGQIKTSFNHEYMGKQPEANSALVTAHLQTSPAFKEINLEKSRCYFCGDIHFNCDCSKYPSARSRAHRLDERNLCKQCLRAKHNNNCSRRPRSCWFCKEAHNSALCPTRFPESKSEHTYKAQTKGTKPGVTLMNRQENKSRAILMTAKCQVVNPNTNATVEARLILDSASHCEYIVEQLSEQLGLTSNTREQVGVKVFGSESTFEFNSESVRFGVKLHDGTVRMVEANTVPVISDVSVLPNGISKEDRKILEPFQTLLADNLDDSNGRVDILLGAGYFWDFIDGQPLVTSTSLKLIPSRLGLLIGGRAHVPYPDDAPKPTAFFCTLQRHNTIVNSLEIIAEPEPKGEIDLSDMWNLERIGIHDDPVKHDDEVAMESFQRTVQVNEVEKRYEVQWPWIPGAKERLPTNETLALGRFKSLNKRFHEDEKLFQGYRDTIHLQVEREIIEKVPANEIDKPQYPAHYLPHHPVLTPQKATTKLRIVYDASARIRKGAMSLNEAMFRGPVILPDLCEILIRFRLHTIAIVADLEKAFLQLLLHPCDRDVTRFFWYEDDNEPILANNLAVYRFRRVTFGVKASPFLLGGVIQLHLTTSTRAIQQQAARDTYVDNLITGTDTPDEGILMYDELKQAFNDVSMNLQEWCSNSEELMARIPESDQVKSRDTKVLGIMWDSTIDTLRLSNRKWSEYSTCSTKREVMTAVATIYDPLGWYQPAMLPAKLLLQTLWVKKYEWDDTIGPECQEQWTELHKSISECFNTPLPLYIGPQSKRNPIIVGFSDASEKAYGTVMYLCNEDETNSQPQLLMSKSRLAPTGKTMSIPRLELLGLLVTANLAKFLRKTFQSDIPVVLFCDSQTVLHWIKSTRTLSKFVTNRITKIRELNDIEFRYVSTKDNPADLNTRGFPGDELVNNDQWWHGPPWLSERRAEWPTHNTETISDHDLEQIQGEYRKIPELFHSFLVGEGQDPPESTGFSAAISVERFPTMQKLLRATIRVLKFLKRFLWDKLQIETKAKYNEVERIMREVEDGNRISSHEMRIARTEWIRSVQRKKFKDVFQAVEKEKKHPLINQLGVRVDSDGILRSYSRYDNAEIPDDLRYPKLLPKGDPFTVLAIREVHETKLHIGVSHTLAEVRREFWIPHGRQAVRSVITNCVKCRRLRGAPFELPGMPPWPVERVSRSAPFQFIGLDYFGPVSIKLEDKTRKCWVCLFTCLTTRAVHLEYVANNNSVEFLNCLKRFMSRRGVPIQIISDNAAQFRVVQAVSERVWSESMTDDSVSTFCANRGVEWKFTTQLAPWQGGFYERLVGVVKSVLRGAVSRKLLEVQEFVTLLCEVEAIVNSRPITCVNDDVHSRTRIIRPADFLISLPICDGPNTEIVRFSDFGTAGANLSKYWNRRNAFLDKLWKCWEDEYLLSLRERGDAIHRGPRSQTRRIPELNEVVLVHDKTPRMTWKLAKIITLIPSHDGQVRSAEILLPNRQVIRRSVKHLIPLEVKPEVHRRVDNANIRDPNETTSEEFWGFSQIDLEEPRRLLRQLDDLDIENPDDDAEPLTLMCLQVLRNIRKELSPTPFPGLF